MRISSGALGAVLILAACAPESGAPDGVSVECAMGEGASFSAACVLEDAGAGAFIIHHPDATFQRFRYDAASGALTLADGAEELGATPDPSAAVLEFSVGDARYRIARETLTATSQSTPQK